MTDFELGADQVAHIDTTLCEMAALDSEQPLHLLVDNHWPETTPGPAILSAALMGSLSDRELDIGVADDDAVSGLLRFGVASALGLRSGQTTFDRSASALNDPELTRIWTPGLRPAVDVMFAEEADARRWGPFGRDFATFVDAHLISGTSASNDVTYLVRRWLGRKLRGRAAADGVLSASARTWIDHVSFAIDELIDNVREHAITAEHPETRSLLRLMFTHDSSTDDGRPKLVCAVVDNGPGVHATLSEKVDVADRELAACQLVGQLLNGALDGWGPGRGAGLSRIVQLARKCDASVTIATGDLRATAEAGAAEVTCSTGFPFQGTVASLAVTLPA